MATKTKPSTQLSLFDQGLDAPAVPVAKPPRRSRLAVAGADTTASAEAVRHVDRIEVIPPDADHRRDRKPSPFEEESYKLYLQLARDVRSLSMKTALATFGVVALVIFGAQIERTVLRLIELRHISQSLMIGVVGWIAVTIAGYTLGRAAFVLKKKHDCGVFYQGVLHFSSNPVMRFVAKLGTALYVGLVAGAIILTLILARQEMIDLIWFIARHFPRAVIGPWDTRTIFGP
jgi:hypothetical protein